MNLTARIKAAEHALSMEAVGATEDGELGLTLLALGFEVFDDREHELDVVDCDTFEVITLEC